METLSVQVFDLCSCAQSDCIDELSEQGSSSTELGNLHSFPREHFEGLGATTARQWLESKISFTSHKNEMQRSKSDAASTASIRPATPPFVPQPTQP